MNPIFERIEQVGIVPVVVLEQSADAELLARTLIEGGLPCIEVTFRTAAAREAIGRITKSLPDLLVGAGTVLTTTQVDAARDAGAAFIVAPGLNRTVVEYCLTKNIPVMPGIATPSELEVALEYGLDVVKFFPSEASGGLEYLKAMSAPYRSVKFVPTGGVQQSNLLSYLKFPKTLAVGGSWMVNPELVASHQFDTVRKLTEDALATMLGFELRHVGVNCGGEQEAQDCAAAMASLLRFPIKDGTSSVFVGTAFEFTKRKFPGAHGHLAIGTHFIRRAIACLERHGCKVRPDTMSEKNGKLIAVYLDAEIGGFAVHLLQL
jgi:2-dehydro-3-deoxyphosphogluconate aldolase/(4S)-4-hydroxy-2-oxoglutarate aldolase